MTKKVIVSDLVVQCVFGVVDDDGDMIQKHPFNLQLPKLRKELLLEAFDILKENRDKLQEQVSNQETLSLRHGP